MFLGKVFLGMRKSKREEKINFLQENFCFVLNFYFNQIDEFLQIFMDFSHQLISVDNVLKEAWRWWWHFHEKGNFKFFFFRLPLTLYCLLRFLVVVKKFAPRHTFWTWWLLCSTDWNCMACSVATTTTTSSSSSSLVWMMLANEIKNCYMSCD